MCKKRLAIIVKIIKIVVVVIVKIIARKEWM